MIRLGSTLLILALSRSVAQKTKNPACQLEWNGLDSSSTIPTICSGYLYRDCGACHANCPSTVQCPLSLYSNECYPTGRELNNVYAGYRMQKNISTQCPNRITCEYRSNEVTGRTSNGACWPGEVENFITHLCESASLPNSGGHRSSASTTTTTTTPPRTTTSTATAISFHATTTRDLQTTTALQRSTSSMETTTSGAFLPTNTVEGVRKESTEVIKSCTNDCSMWMWVCLILIFVNLCIFGFQLIRAYRLKLDFFKVLPATKFRAPETTGDNSAQYGIPQDDNEPSTPHTAVDIEEKREEATEEKSESYDEARKSDHLSADLDGPTDSTRNTQSSVLSRNLCNEYSIEAVSGINDVARQAVESIGFRRQSNPSGLQRQSSNDLGTEFSRQSNDEGSVDVVTKRNDIGRQSSKYLGAEFSGGGRGKVLTEYLTPVPTKDTPDLNANENANSARNTQSGSFSRQSNSEGSADAVTGRNNSMAGASVPTVNENLDSTRIMQTSTLNPGSKEEDSNSAATGENGTAAQSVEPSRSMQRQFSNELGADFTGRGRSAVLTEYWSPTPTNDTNDLTDPEKADSVRSTQISFADEFCISDTNEEDVAGLNEIDGSGTDNLGKGTDLDSIGSLLNFRRPAQSVGRENCLPNELHIIPPGQIKPLYRFGDRFKRRQESSEGNVVRSPLCSTRKCSSAVSRPSS